MNRSSKWAISLLVAIFTPVSGGAQALHPSTSLLPSFTAARAGNAEAALVRIVSLPGSTTVIGGENGNGVMDLGRVSYFSSGFAREPTKKDKTSSTVTARFGIELVAPAGATAGTAMLSAYLAEPSKSCIYLVDGVRLTTAPQMISARVRYGVVSAHHLEIQVPTSAPAGEKRTSIIWVATPEE